MSWQRCYYILKHYEEQIHSAEYALQVLETLRQQILGPLGPLEQGTLYTKH